MKFERFFVTSVFTLAILALVACNDKPRESRATLDSRKAANNALLAEGESTLAASDVIRAELQTQFKIDISDTPIAVASGKTVDNKTLGKDYNWNRLTLQERQVAKERLASYMTHLTRIIEIDAKRGIYVTQIQKIYDRKAAAESHIISLNNFERLRGEQFNPPTAGTGSVYRGIDGN